MKFNSHVMQKLNSAVSAVIMVSLISFYAQVPVLVAHAEETAPATSSDETTIVPAIISEDAGTSTETTPVTTDVGTTTPVEATSTPTTTLEVATGIVSAPAPQITVANAHQDDFSCSTGQRLVTRVSNGSVTYVGGNQNAALVSSIPASWSSISGASWIWSENPISSNPNNDITRTFSDSFNVNGTITNASLKILADNTFSAQVNGHSVAASSQHNNYSSVSTYSINPSVFSTSTNAFVVSVTNEGLNEHGNNEDNNDPSRNPAGLDYSLSLCVTPAPVLVSIALIGSSTINVIAGSPFIDPGVTATDTDNSVLTISSSTSPSPIDTSVGSTTFVITYTATTGSVSASTTRTVHIIPFVPECTVATSTVVSDTSTMVNDGTSSLVAWIHPAWTASIQDANWIWSAPQIDQADFNETQTFTKTFTVSGSVANAKLDIAADNTYTAYLNGHIIGATLNERNFESSNQATYVINPNLLVDGTNTLTFQVTNIGIPWSLPTSNPAGVMYKFTYNGSSCGTTGGEVSAPMIALNGSSTMALVLGTTFTDPGATASDTIDGDITSQIVTSGQLQINPSVVSTTSILYFVTNSSHVSAFTTRTVVFIATSSDNGGGDNGTTTGTTTNPGGGDDTGTTTATTTATTTTPGGNDNPGGGSTGGGSIIPNFVTSGFGTGGTGTSTLGALGLSCPFMTDYVFQGHANKTEEIKKLQLFLKVYEGNTSITVNGILDDATIAGIKAFQAKHLADTMGPWKSNTPSGKVYITTLKAINFIVCNTKPVLTPAEQAIIDAYTTGGSNGAGNPPANNNGGENTNTPAVTSTTTSTTTAPVGEQGNGNANLTGAAGQSGLLQSLWAFITGFFH